MVTTTLNTLTAEQIAQRLTQSGSVETDEPYPPGLLKEPLRPAAVLIPLLRIEGEWHVLFIRRAEHAEDLHSGQVAFPGGGSHPRDKDLITTALREAYEEIGLAPADVRILGTLNEFITISSYRVTPVIGVMPWPYHLILDPNEVSRAFTIPLEWLANPDNHSIQERILPPPYRPASVIYFQPYDGELLWGASARFALGLVWLLSGEKETKNGILGPV